MAGPFLYQLQFLLVAYKMKDCVKKCYSLKRIPLIQSETQLKLFYLFVNLELSSLLSTLIMWYIRIKTHNIYSTQYNIIWERRKANQPRLEIIRISNVRLNVLDKWLKMILNKGKNVFCVKSRVWNNRSPWHIMKLFMDPRE